MTRVSWFEKKPRSMGGAGKAEATPSQKGQQEKEKMHYVLAGKKKEERKKEISK